MSRWTPPTRTTWWAFGSAVAITAATAAFLASSYATLPFGVPVQFVRGVPMIYQVKTPRVVMLPAAVQAALLIVFGAVMLLLLWRARPGTDGDARGAADTGRMRLAAEGIALLSAVWIAVQALGAFRLIVLWRRGGGGYGDVYSLAIVTAVVASIVIGVRTLKLVGGQRENIPVADPTVWRLRNLYFNPSDPALFVPMRTGGGWTLNFGRPLAIILLAALLILGLGGPLVFARLVLRGFWA